MIFIPISTRNDTIIFQMNHLLSIFLFVIVLSPSESQNNLGFFGLSDLPEPPKPGGGSVPYPGQFWDLVEVASASGKFKTLIKIIKDLGLVQPLRGILHLQAHVYWLFIEIIN